MFYWAFPSGDRVPDDVSWNNKVLGYNLKNNTWSINDDSITAFGYYDATIELPETQATANSLNRFVIAGNQQGYVFVLNPDEPSNCEALQITNIELLSYDPVADESELTLTVIDHNLSEDDFILIEHATADMAVLSGRIFQVEEVFDEHSIRIIVDTEVGTDYNGGGTIARVSRVDIFTKDYNFYLNEGFRSYLQRVDFLVSKEDNSSIQVDYFTDTSLLSLTEASDNTGSISGTNVLDLHAHLTFRPYEAEQDLLWRPLYFQAEGAFYRLRFFYSDEQMLNPEISLEDFELHAMVFYVGRTTEGMY